MARGVPGTVAFAVVLLLTPLLMGASYRTANFVCTAPTPELAKACAECAEANRKKLADEWLGQTLPDWPEPTPIVVRPADNLGGGATQFHFTDGRLVRIQCNVEGRPDKILSSVIPHETLHMVLASHFRQPVPRLWDEGSATNAEAPDELARQDRICRDFLNGGKAIPLKQLLASRDYPPGQDGVMALYAEGSTLVRYLAEAKGKLNFTEFVGYGMANGWDAASRRYYGFSGVDGMQQAWLQYLRETKAQPTTGGGGNVSSPTAAASGPPPAGGSGTPGAPAAAGLSDSQKLDAILVGVTKLSGDVSNLKANDARQDARLTALEQRATALEQRQQQCPCPQTGGPAKSNAGAAIGGGSAGAPTITPIQGWSQPPVRQQSQPIGFAQPYPAGPSAQGLPFYQGCPPGQH